jgi:hypothetical protein
LFGSWRIEKYHSAVGLFSCRLYSIAFATISRTLFFLIVSFDADEHMGLRQ